MKKKHVIISLLFLIGLSSCAGGNGITYSAPDPNYDVSNKEYSDTNGIITIDNNSYYKVKSLVSDQKYIIGYNDGDKLISLGNSDKGNYITYTAKTGGGSNSKPSSSLKIDTYTLDIVDDKLVFVDSSETESNTTTTTMPEITMPETTMSSTAIPSDTMPKKMDNKSVSIWSYEDNILALNKNNTIYYIKYDNGFSATTNLDEATKLNAYTNGSSLSKCITKQMDPSNFVDKSNIIIPSYNIDVEDGLILDDVIWDVDGKKYDTDLLSFSPTDLSNADYGVYPIYASIKAHDNDFYYYAEDSYKANFMITTGIIPNSLLTFSDTHEEFFMIGSAIEEIMNKNEGKIPSLVVATGDFVNGATPPDEIIQNEYLPQIKGELSGIDSVYVAGNHESYLSIANASISANLGADDSLLDGIGVIFNSNSDAYKTNAKSSLYLNNLIVYGINYFSLEMLNSEGMKTYSYQNVITDLKAFLEELKDTYNGELILISSHAGLHTLGVDPNSSITSEFAGNNSYNINMSNEVVDLLNYYAKNYNMNFTFQFGHNHSKGEDEFIITPGERIYTTKSFDSKEVINKEIYFTYANQGYLSSQIGSAECHYSFITWDDENYYLNFNKLNDLSIQTVVEKY